MNKFFKISLMLLAAAMVLSSCTSIDIESRISDQVVSMTPIPEEIDHKIVGSFDEQMRVYFTINGLIPTSQLELDKTIRNRVEKYHGDGVANLRINDQLSGIDILIQTGLSIGGYLLGAMLSPNADYAGVYGTMGASAAQFFVQSRTVTVRGDVFKLE